MRVTPLNVATVLALLAAAGAMSPAAEAQSRRGPDGQGYVTAHSRYGAASITAPVRVGPYGRPEVRLPGGTWIECRQTCSDTLRRETVDFWNTRSPNAADGAGYLRFRF